MEYNIDIEGNRFIGRNKKKIELIKSPIIIETDYNSSDLTINAIFRTLYFIYKSNNINLFIESIVKCFRLQKEDFDLLLPILNSNLVNQSSNKFSLLKVNDKLELNEVYYFAFLYLIKKIEKISRIYSEYQSFNFLFNSEISLKEKYRKTKMQFNNDLDNIFKNRPVNKSNITSLIYEYFPKFKTSLAPAKSIENEYTKTLEQKLLSDAILKEVFKKDSKVDKIASYKIIISNFEQFFQKKRLEQFEFYLESLWIDKSHVTFKLKQVLSYFKNKSFNKMIKSNMYDKKLALFKIIVKESFIVSNKIEEVPLAFFDVKVNLKKSESNDLFSFSNLSSGEQQMIFSLMTITSNLYNLQSTYRKLFFLSSNVYRNINLIFDEIELYFHPEYQRKYVNQLIETLKFFTEDTKYPMNINVIFSTHSPFILSDIPSQNILKLEEGIQLKDKETVNSFGANIHDLLANEFFLKEGTVGEFANKKISELINFMYLNIKIKELEEDEKNLSVSDTEIKESYTTLLKHFKDKLEKIPKYSSQEIRNQLKLIGEPLVRLKMQEMLVKMNDKELNHKN